MADSSKFWVVSKIFQIAFCVASIALEGSDHIRTFVEQLEIINEIHNNDEEIIEDEIEKVIEELMDVLYTISYDLSQGDTYGKGIQNQDSETRVVIGFVKQIFQRRLASSTYAVYRSLQNRLEKVDDFLNNFTTSEDIIELSDEDIDAFNDMTEDERELAEQSYTGRIIILNEDYLELEKRVLEELIVKCEVVLNTSDPKIDELKNALDEHLNAKIVIFTEYKDTLDYIKRRLPGYSSVSIDGSVKFSDRTKIMEDFWIPLEEGGPRIMVGTDAAGEGIDLQISTVLINYDIPWNPNRLEQRMGRIHRIGQEYPVLFVNTVAADTQEGQVLVALLITQLFLS